MRVNRENLSTIFDAISRTMSEHRSYLITLDQQAGDGDLGISMDEGYRAIATFLQTTTEDDLGKLFMSFATLFNEAAPSSLGTITSFAFMGMAKQLKGKTEAGLDELIEAMEAGIARIMEKAKSKPGEKTILDSLYPAVKALDEHRADDARTAFAAAAQAAAKGAEMTKGMMPVHGRAAYYGERSVGLLDGGAEVGRLLFEAIARCLAHEEG